MLTLMLAAVPGLLVIFRSRRCGYGQGVPRPGRTRLGLPPLAAAAGGREPGGFEAAHEYLQGKFPSVPPEQILVGMEFAGHHGHTFAAFLKELGYVVAAVLPMVTKRHKEDQDNSPLKNDQKDAGLVCKPTGEGKFVGFAQLDVPFGEMRSLATQRHRLSVEGVRYRIRLQGLLDAPPGDLGRDGSLGVASGADEGGG